MDIIEEMAGMLNYLNGHNRPKVTALRNPRRVKVDGPWPYSFIFEAEINGKWKTYGPYVQINFTIENGGEPYRLPCHDSLYGPTDTGTIDIGWHSLNKAFGHLPLEESGK